MEEFRPAFICSSNSNNSSTISTTTATKSPLEVSGAYLGELGVDHQPAVAVAALISRVVVLVPLVSHEKVACCRHLGDDLAPELGLHRRYHLLRRLLLFFRVVEDGTPDDGFVRVAVWDEDCQTDPRSS